MRDDAATVRAEGRRRAAEAWIPEPTERRDGRSRADPHDRGGPVAPHQSQTAVRAEPDDPVEGAHAFAGRRPPRPSVGGNERAARVEHDAVRLREATERCVAARMPDRCPEPLLAPERATAAGRARRNNPPVAADGGGGDAGESGRAGRRAQQLQPLAVDGPDARASGGRRHDAPAVRAEDGGEVRDAPVRVVPRSQRDARRRARDDDVPVPGHGGELTAVWRERKRVRPAHRRGSDLLARRQLPDPHDPVRGRHREQPPVGAERGAGFERCRPAPLRGMEAAEAGQCGGEATAARTPDVGVAGLADRDEQPAVPAEEDPFGGTSRAIRRRGLFDQSSATPFTIVATWRPSVLTAEAGSATRGAAERGIVRAAGRPSALRHVRREPAGVCAARSLPSALKASAPRADVARLARDAPVVPPGRDHVLDRVGEDRAPQRGSRLGCGARLDGLDAVGERGDGFGRERPLGPGGERLRARDPRSVVGGVALEERDDAEGDGDGEGERGRRRAGCAGVSRRRAGSRARSAAAARSGSAPWPRSQRGLASAWARSRPRRSRLLSLRVSQSTARTSSRVCARAQSRSVSSALESFANAASRSSPSRHQIQFSCRSPGWAASGSAPSQAIGTIRLPRSWAWRNSAVQYSDASEWVETTKTKLSAPSMLSLMSRSHSRGGRNVLPVHPDVSARPAQERVQLPHEAAVVARVGDEDVRHAGSGGLCFESGRSAARTRLRHRPLRRRPSRAQRDSRPL